MVKGLNLKSNELPCLNLLEKLHVQPLTCGANLLTRHSSRADWVYSLTCGVRMSVSTKNRKRGRAARVCGVSNAGARVHGFWRGPAGLR